MILTDAGGARVRGYLYVFERSLRAAQPPSIVSDAVREVESHIRDRIAETDPLPDERAALERILAALGTPTRVARAYSLELSVDEALVSGRLVATVRVIWLMATMTVGGFVGALFLITGYLCGAILLIAAAAQPFVDESVITMFGRPQRGWWVIPFCVMTGLGLLVLTHKGARAWIRWIRTRINRKESV